MAYRFNSSSPAWSFKAGRFQVALFVQRDRGFRYDGDDADGETQAKLDDGEYVAFDSTVCVFLDGNEIAADYLGASVYDSDRVAEFWTDHRSADPMNRNCSIMRAACGNNCCIGHYFPDMVRNAIRDARKAVRAMPVPPIMRESAK